MLGFHSDGIRLFGASDTLKANLKKRKLPLVGSTTGNTLVFAIDDETVIHWCSIKKVDSLFSRIS